MCHRVPVKVRGQFRVAISLLTLCGSQSLNSGHQVLIARTIFSDLALCFFFLPFFPLDIHTPAHPYTLHWPWNRLAPLHSQP